MSDTGATFRSGFVALVGRPNVGKSTLLNRLVGSKISIVSDKPQTTRNRVSGAVNLPGGQLVFVDTPGIHRPLHRMNERMMRIALAALFDVDLVAVLTDVTEPFGQGDRFLVETLGRVKAPVFLLVNKVDRVRKAAVLPVIATWARSHSFAEVYPVSALTGDGVPEAVVGMLSRLPEGPPLFTEGQWTDVSERFLAAEVVREKVLARTREELPYTTTVLVESFEEPEDERGVLRIEATVLVERESQTGILVGRGGAAIKAVGSEARRELEQLLGRRVFLGLRVKARKGWRDDDTLLDSLGLPR